LRLGEKILLAFPPKLNRIEIEVKQEHCQGLIMKQTSIFDLSPAEKLLLVEDLWDDLASCAPDVPVHEWQKEELVRRKTNLAANPNSLSDWEEVKSRIRRHHATEG
jgi:putative addiction module component (TIGR02574 family)